MEKAGFLFSGAGGSGNGPGKDRALVAGNDTRIVSSIAATGFGLTALCIGAQRAISRVRTLPAACGRP